jgi:hypothetical protein
MGTKIETLLQDEKRGRIDETNGKCKLQAMG